jgi:hypothetical protein
LEIACGNAIQKFLALRGQPKQHFPEIVFIAQSPNHSSRLETMRQFHGAMVPNLKALGQHTNGRFLRGREPLNGKQSQVLLRFDSGFPRGKFGEIQKAANFVPKSRQSFVVDSGLHRFVFQGFRLPA